jgi:arylsulfatase A-like enzyme
VARTRSNAIVGTALVIVALALYGCSPGPRHTVVVLLLDTVRWDALGCYGNPNAPTPSIDAIAADGVRFEQAISTSGWTLPAVGSLLTGTWPTIHGGLGKSATLTPIRDEVPTAAEVLKDHGMRTMAIANAAFVSPMLRLDRGFDTFDHEYTYNWDTRRADATVDVAIEWLRTHERRSNFFLIHLFDPHLDYDPPGRYQSAYTGGRKEPPAPLTHSDCLSMQNGDDPPSAADVDYIKALYAGEIAFMDAQIARLVAELKALGLYEEATVIVVADHGEEFWEHGGFEHGHTLYDELVRVPLIVKPPASVARAGDRVPHQVRIVDVMPTVFDLLGITAPPSFIGESLLPLIRGESVKERFAFCESTLYGANKIAWRGERYKYILDLEKNASLPEALYDWQTDPGELKNLIGSHPEVAEDMRSSLSRLVTEMSLEVRTMSKPEVVDMSPEEIRKLRSLGYIR